MTAFHFEAKKYSLRQAKDGVVVSFLVHPNDVVPELLSASIGEHYVVALAPYTEQGPPSSTGLEHGASIPAVGGSNPPADTTPAPKERRPFRTLPRSQQAALLCNDNRFWWWLSDKEDRRIGPPPPGHPPYVETEQEAADAVRSMCGVASRRDLDQPDHALKWDRMVEEFSAASGRATWERPA